MAAHSTCSACSHPIVLISHRLTSIPNGNLETESPTAASQHEPHQRRTSSDEREDWLCAHIFKAALGEYATAGACAQANIKLRSFVDMGEPIEGLAAEYFHKVLRDDTNRRGRHVVTFPPRRNARDRPATEEDKMEEEAKKDKLRKVQEGRIAIPGKFMIKTSALLNVVKTLKEGEEKRREEKVRKDQEADDVPPWSRDWSPSPPLDSPRFPADSEEEAEEAKERKKVNWGDEMYYDGSRKGFRS